MHPASPTVNHRFLIGHSAQFRRYDTDGKRTNYLDCGIQVNLKQEQYAHIMATNAPIPYRMTLDLPSGQIALRIVVYDPSAATIGSLELPIAVAAK